jgi:hypothetical protein
MKHDAFVADRAELLPILCDCCPLKTTRVIITQSLSRVSVTHRVHPSYCCVPRRPTKYKQVDFSAVEYKTFNNILVKSLTDLVPVHPAVYQLGHKVHGVKQIT